MKWLMTTPPKVDWDYQRGDLERQKGQDPIKVYVDKLQCLLQWDEAELDERQTVKLQEIWNECKYHLDHCYKHYVLVRDQLYPVMNNIDLWLRFFAPLADKHLWQMWLVTPYVPKVQTNHVSVSEAKTMLNNLAHLFKK
jgi:hypothetical protein